MAAGDWVQGSYIQLSPSTLTIDLATGKTTIAANWMVVLPSGMRTGFLDSFQYQANTSNSVDQETATLATLLAQREAIPVEIPGGNQINPDGSITPLGPYVDPRG